MTTRATNHWRGVVAVALVTGAVGLLFERPLVLLTACVGVGYAAYPHLTSPPPVEVSVERRLAPVEATPGEAVSVTVTVTNEGERFLPDLRVVDGPPATLPVRDGTPRHAAALRPGGTTTFEYTLEAAHGTHRFRPTTVLARDPTGAHEVEETVDPATDALECLTAVPEVPIDRDTRPFPGNVVTDDSGTGIEFSRVREYRRGDESSRIDWNRLARTGVLSTVEFRSEQSADAVVCVDARPTAYVGAEGGPHAVSHAVAAAHQLLAAVWAVDERAGLAAIGREFCWLGPGRGPDHRRRVRETLLSHPALSPDPPEDGTVDADRQTRELRTRLGPSTQVLLVTPLADGAVVDTALELSAGGRAVTVVSPDVTTSETLGAGLAAVERRNRVQTLRRADVRVVDWDPETTLAAAVLRAERRWSR